MNESINIFHHIQVIETLKKYFIDIKVLQRKIDPPFDSDKEGEKKECHLDWMNPVKGDLWRKTCLCCLQSNELSRHWMNTFFVFLLLFVSINYYRVLCLNVLSFVFWLTTSVFFTMTKDNESKSKPTTKQHEYR